VSNLVGKACERLWREQPCPPAGSSISNDGLADSTGATGGNPNPSIEETLNCSVDGYISQYFRHVAELSRESVYQAHQREILRRMRTDLIAGERSGNLKEIDDMIQKVEVEDRSLQAEISNLMRIADNSSGSSTTRCPMELGPCAPCVCLADNSYPPLPDGYAASVRAVGSRGPDAAVVSLGKAENGSGEEESAGKGMPPCRPCLMQ
jgi:hypothetical protein